MAVTPAGRIDLSQGIRIEEQPSLTWYVDPKTNRIRGTADGLQAVSQTVEIILHVERFWWQIYGPYFGMQWEGLIGQDPGYVASELQRRILDAFSVDRRILGIEGFSYSIEGSSLTASMVVKTVYGDIPQRVEVTAN